MPEKIFYARCITLNRFKFSYGRKPKGKRLRSIDPPNFPSAWKGAAGLTIGKTASRLVGCEAIPPERAAAESGLVPLEELFEIRNGHGLDLASLDRAPQGGVRFASRAKRNNGVSAYVRRIVGVEPYTGNQLTCALNGEGGVLYTFLQDEPFYTAYHVACLRPKLMMTREELLFYCTCIRANRFRYSYGRQANRTIRTIRVPSLGAIPDWVYGAVARIIAGGDSDHRVPAPDRRASACSLKTNFKTETLPPAEGFIASAAARVGW